MTPRHGTVSTGSLDCKPVQAKRKLCVGIAQALGVVPGPWQRQPNDGGISCIAVPKEAIMLVVKSDWDLELVASGGYQITPAAMAVGTSSATATLRGFGSSLEPRENQAPSLPPGTMLHGQALDPLQ